MRDVGRDEPTDKQLAEILELAKVTAYASGATRCEADDVAQTTATKLWARWNDENVADVRCAALPQWRAYIRRVAKNTHHDLIKQHRRRISRDNKAAGGREAPLPPRPSNTNSAPADPDGIDSYLAREFIIQQIRSLPVRQRAVADLVFVQELSVREAAEQLSIQPQSVRKHLRAARETLTDRITQDQRQSL